MCWIYFKVQFGISLSVFVKSFSSFLSEFASSHEVIQQRALPATLVQILYYRDSSASVILMHEDTNLNRVSSGNLLLQPSMMNLFVSRPM